MTDNQAPSPPTINLFGGDPYTCQHTWPDDCFIQAGKNGIVFDKESYTTGYFEAFPEIGGFIRGEGETVKGAEAMAWEEFSRTSNCDHPKFKARGYENGGGFCVSCGLFMSNVIESPHACTVCGISTWFSESEVSGDYYCKEHRWEKPIGEWDECDWDAAYMDNWKRKRNEEWLGIPVAEEKDY